MSHPVLTLESIISLPRAYLCGQGVAQWSPLLQSGSSLLGDQAHDFIFLTLDSTEWQAAVIRAVICCFSWCSAVFRLLREGRFGA